MTKIKDILKQETIVINNPGPKLLAFIEKIRDYKDRKIKETKVSYLRNGFMYNDGIVTFYRYKNSADLNTNLNDKYNLHIIASDHPEDEVIEKIDNVLSILNISERNKLDVVVIKNEQNKYQLFTVYINGNNNGKENILNPMKKIVSILEKLEDNEHVEWCQVLDTEFDNVDDIFSWYITIILK